MKSAAVLSCCERLKLLLVVFVLLWANSVIAQHPGDADTAAKARIRQVLLRSLKPSDLDLPKKQLKEKLLLIAAGTSAFEEEIEDRWLVPVKRAKGQWVLIVRTSSQSDEIEVPYKGYWIGAVSGKVLVTSLPDNVDGLTGPPEGEWRKHGRYILGVGLDLATHSPNWCDGDLLVFTLGKTGLIRHFADQFNWARSLNFVSNDSDDVVGVENQGEYAVIQRGRDGANEECYWHFKNGSFVQGTLRPVHDRTWALDQLLVSVKRGNQRKIKRMVPVISDRRWLVNELRRCMRNDLLYLDDQPRDGSLGLTGHFEGAESHFTLLFKMTHSGWVISKIEKR